jgi:dipeptidyl aminopeptidase/acylaminoacyl peptidase
MFPAAPWWEKVRIVHKTPDEKLAVQALIILVGLLVVCVAHAGRALVPQDWYRFQALSDLQMAPDGTAVAYLVTHYDKELDESRTALWRTDWTGGESVQLTRGESVSEPRFSPDGRYISFLSARPADGPAQLWALDRRGGEARTLSHLDGEIVAYEWAPDSTHAVLVVRSAAREKSVKPIVLETSQFKKDGQGYLTSGQRTHLYLLDTRTGVAEPLTHDPARTDSLPVFSPDSHRVAFLSSAFDDPHGVGLNEIYLVDAVGGSMPRLLVSTEAPRSQSLEWSPDGSLVAFMRGAELKYNAYSVDRLAVAELATGKIRMLTDVLDRPVLLAKFASDSRSILFCVEDDGICYPARVNLETGAIDRLGERMVVHDLATAKGHVAVLVSSDSAPIEAFALEAGHLRRLSAHNRELFGELELGSVEDIVFESHDRTQVHGQLVKPPGFVAGRRYPTIVWIHGGPNSQDEHSLELWSYGTALDRQFFATHGYVVLAINYRGGAGRGAQYARAILADWGHKEVEDLLAGVDYAVARGSADPGRLAIGGWSYGGILTDYTIAKDTRFKAAISGAGSGNQTAMYGVDQYVTQYNNELEAPWHHTALWMKLSYPLFHADRIRTPTLFLGGDEDSNVPLVGGEQMYQALRTLGVPTQLVVYPGEHHMLTRPSFLVDRTQRYLDWVDRYLAPAGSAR